MRKQFQEKWEPVFRSELRKENGVLAASHPQE
jgi:hypothetical protein